MIGQNKSAYLSIGNPFQKQIKTIEDWRENQIKVIKDHGKQLTKINVFDKERWFWYLW